MNLKSVFAAKVRRLRNKYPSEPLIYSQFPSRLVSIFLFKFAFCLKSFKALHNLRASLKTKFSIRSENRNPFRPVANFQLNFISQQRKLSICSANSTTWQLVVNSIDRVELNNA